MDLQQGAMLRRHKAISHCSIQELEQTVVITGHIQQGAGFVVKTQLQPSERFKQFLQGSKPPRQRDHGIGQFHHARLADVHVGHDLQAREPVVGHLGIHQHVRDHTDHLAISRQHRIGQGPHQTNPGGSVHQPHTAAGHRRSKSRSGLQMLRSVAGSGSAVDREALHRLSGP